MLILLLLGSTQQRKGKTMYERPERERGVVVHNLNQEKLTDLVKKALVATHGSPMENLTEITAWVQFAGEYFDNEQGYSRMVLINEEGVGYSSDEMNRVTVLYNSNGFGSSGWIDLHRSLIKTCFTNEETDLADVVRKFGDRLETNFQIWHSKLK